MDDNDIKRKEILDLLASGKITAEEASALLGAARKPEIADSAVEESGEEQVLSETPADSGAASWLHVRVSDMKSGNNKVTVNVPLKLVKFGLGIGKRFTSELDDFDLDQLGDLASMGKGMLVEVEDEEDNEHVQIYID